MEKSRRAETVSKALDATAARLRREAQKADRAKQNEILRALCPTREFGFTLSKKDGRVEVEGRICLEVAEGARVAIEVA